MKILVLGDCQSNGNNCFADEIMQDHAPRSWSLRHHGQEARVVSWAMMERQRMNIGGTFHWPSDAWKHLRQRELGVAWPSLLPGVVQNLSINGAHFLGHCERFRRSLISARPDHVIITDHRLNHVGFVVRSAGERWVFEGDHYKESDYREQYSRELHGARLRGQSRELARSRRGSVCKHRRSYLLLERMIRNEGIPFSVLRFGGVTAEEQEIFDSFMPTHIDCSELFRGYTSDGGMEWGTRKRQQQAAIARRVSEQLLLKA